MVSARRLCYFPNHIVVILDNSPLRRWQAKSLDTLKLFETLRQHHCTLISLKENIDFSTATGRMFANILASFAAYDNETRTERILAGQAAAKAAGKTIGGSKRGTLCPILRRCGHAANVMVLPYLNMQQISSGILADTVGSVSLLSTKQDVMKSINPMRFS